MRPADTSERFLAHGFTYGGDDIGMAVELTALPEEVPVVEDLEIERVRDEETLAAWQGTLARGFGEGPVWAEWVGEMYRRLGLGDDGAVAPLPRTFLRGAGCDLHAVCGHRCGRDLLCLHRRRGPAAGHWRSPLPGTVARGSEDGL
jgi:hypothetical protein